MLLKLRSLAALAGFALADAGCPSPCEYGPWGDGKGSPELAIVARTLDGEAVELTADGAQVDLTFPVQGGHVLFLGAKVKNVAACRSELSAKLIDPLDGHVAAEEKRQVDFSVAVDGGNGQSNINDTSQLANVPACPDFLDRDIVQTSWTLEMSVTDPQGHSVKTTRQVTPVCRQTDPQARALCECECRGGYYFGRCGAGADGGTDGG